VKLPPFSAHQRRIDAVSNERVHELESIRHRPQKRVAQQRLASTALIADQGPEVGEGEALTKDRSRLDCAPVIRGEKIGPREHDALNRARKSSVDKIAGRPQQLFEEQRVASGALHAFGRERPAGFKSESVAGFLSECMAGFVGMPEGSNRSRGARAYGG